MGSLSENQLEVILKVSSHVPLSSLHPASKDIRKAQYASTLLYVSSLGCAKLAVLLFIKSISPIQGEKRLSDVILLLEIIICGWCISGEVIEAFSCKIPHPWDYLHAKCINSVSAAPSGI